MGFAVEVPLFERKRTTNVSEQYVADFLKMAEKRFAEV